MTVSIIIPAHNHQEYIGACLDSVAAYASGAEVLVLDDGSTDMTPDVIEEWARRHPSVGLTFWRQENAGLTVTLNRLLSRAAGEFVTMLASDDRLGEGGVTARIEYLNPNPQHHAVIGDCRVIDSAGRVIRERGVADGRANARRRLLSHPSHELVELFAIPGPVLLYRRDSILGIGGYYREHGNNTVGQPLLRALLARELQETALRNLPLFGGRLRWALRHEAATFAWRAAQAEGSHTSAAYHWTLSRLLKVVSLTMPKRQSDLRGVSPPA